MTRENRRGKRKTRDQRIKRKLPELGYYLIVTDTEATERCYFNGLHEYLTEDVRDKIVIKVVETKTAKLVDKCKELTAYDAQYRIPWIVFDRDRVVNFDKIIKEAENNGIQVGWSNPCFEIWLFAYYGNMPNIKESFKCCSDFGHTFKNKTGIEYSKADDKIYSRLIKTGDELNAIKVAERKLNECKNRGEVKPSEMYPATTVHELIKIIKDAVIKENN